MTAVAIIQARMGSTRLPGKTLEDLAGMPVLGWVTRAAVAIPGIDRTVVATTTRPGDDAIAEWCSQHDISCHRGPEEDVLARFAQCAAAEQADIILRLTADCPFLDPQICGGVLMLLRKSGCDYASNVSPPSWPDGLDCEVMRADALKTADAEALRPSERQHVTPFIRNNRERFAAANLSCPIPGLEGERWTLDTEDDLIFLRKIAEQLPSGRALSYIEILQILDDQPALKQSIGAAKRNQSFIDQLELEAPSLDRTYTKSDEFYRRAERTIPLGSQTFSKSRMQFPENAAPLYVSHGFRGRVWDVDGNDYVDMMGALLPVVLGYCDPDVDAAIRRQLDCGISFSLSTPLEAELAEILVDIIPSAEMVRFGKNGTDATSAAVRLARAFTGRDRIAVCGYHGWQDWYIGATSRNKGVPAAVSELTHNFPYNDLGALDQLLSAHRSEFAAVILEPMGIIDPAPGYLRDLKSLVQDHGALLIFDEIITGFRFDLGGAQKMSGVTPDLCTLGKSMGNGMPISAVTGRADVMGEMEHIFFSGTFGGETLSLAAAIAVITKMRKEPVIETLWKTGAALMAGIENLIAEFGLGEWIRIEGQAPWSHLGFDGGAVTSAAILRTLFLGEALRAGVLTLGSHNICYSHDRADISRVLSAYQHAFEVVKDALDKGDAESRLAGKPIEPVFRVR